MAATFRVGQVATRLDTGRRVEIVKRLPGTIDSYLTEDCQDGHSALFAATQLAPAPPEPRIKVLCNECGHKFSVRRYADTCPTCGGADIDPREAPAARPGATRPAGPTERAASNRRIVQAATAAFRKDKEDQ